MRFVSLLLLLPCLFLEANFLETLQKKQVIIPKLRAFILTSEGEIPPEYVRKSAKGVEFYRIPQNLSKREREELSRGIEKMAVGQPLTYEMIEQIEEYLSRYYKEQKHLVLSTHFCEMGTSEEVAILSLTESRLGEIRLKGNKHLSTDYYLESISLRENDPLQIGKIENDLAFFSKEGGKKISIDYQPGKSYGKTDVEIAIEDKPLFNVEASSDNYGAHTIGGVRLFTKLSLNNLLNFDQTLSYTYETAPNFGKIQGHALSYALLLPSQVEIKADASYAHLSREGGLVPENWIGAISYTFPLSPLFQFLQKAGVGCFYAETNNDYLQGEAVLSPHFARSAAISFHYTLSCFTKAHSFSLGATLLSQPLPLGASMSKLYYDFLQPGASPFFLLSRATLSYLWAPSPQGVNLSLTLQAQYSPFTLLPLHRLSLGGRESIRGYPEHYLNVDQGYFAQLEVASSPFSLSRKRLEQSRLLLFTDLGDGEGAPTPLLGVGCGLRSFIGEYVHGEAYWGWPILTLRAPLGKLYFRCSALY